MIAAAGRLTPPLRALRHQTLIGLLAVTAMRPAEGARARPRRRRPATPHGPRRQAAQAARVPLHDSTVTALGEYVRQRDARFPQPTTPAFFISARGGPVARHELNQTFTQLIRQAGLDGRGTRARPRPYDLRHAFAVRTVLDWYAAGDDVDRKMPLLSTFLGHADPASTYWYLQAVPELLAVISSRLERLPGVSS